MRARNRRTGGSSGCPLTSTSSRARAEPDDRAGPGRATRPYLGDQVVVLGRDRSPASMPCRRGRRARGHHPAADPPGVGAKSRAGSSAGTRTSIACGRRGGAAAAASVVTRAASRPARTELFADEVEAGDQLGHAVLHLEARVDLEEPEPPVGSSRNSAVAAFRGRRRSPTRTASSWRSRRCVSSRPGAGASSTSFWWRRWSEQSRSPMRRPVPWVAQQLDLDVARRPDPALEVDAPSPNAARPRVAGGERRGRSPRRSTRRMPRPPPPAAALTRSGKPIRAAVAEDRVDARRGRPARVERARDDGTPRRRRARRAASLSPSAEIVGRGRRRDPGVVAAARTPRARRGIRSPDGPHRRPRRAPLRPPRRRAGSSRSAGRARSEPPRRPRGRARAGVRIGVDGDRLDAELAAARMTRSAISPRFAISTRRNGRRARRRDGRRFAQRRRGAGSEGDVAVLLRAGSCLACSRASRARR